MMTGSAPSGYQRSYDRNLAWCRFWLTIGIAVATLSFTFMAEQGFRPITDPSAEEEKKPESAPDALAAGATDSTPTPSPEERIEWFDILVFAFLIFTAGSCILVSYRFRLLYMKDDSALEGMVRNNQEATP